MTFDDTKHLAHRAGNEKRQGISTLSDEQLNGELCALTGWKPSGPDGHGWTWSNDRLGIHTLGQPDFAKKLDAVASAELAAGLNEVQQQERLAHLYIICGGGGFPVLGDRITGADRHLDWATLQRMTQATARQRSEALLWTLRTKTDTNSTNSHQ